MQELKTDQKSREFERRTAEAIDHPANSIADRAKAKAVLLLLDDVEAWRERALLAENALMARCGNREYFDRDICQARDRLIARGKIR